MKNIVVYNVGRIQLPILPRSSSVGDAVVVALVGPQTLSAVVEPALLSTSVVALHMVQFAQVFWFDAVENFPVEHATQVRSALPVPLAAIF